MLEELRKKNLECTGCGACRNVCPVNAIQMKEDALGFLEPKVLEDICIQCNLCLEVCPVLTPQSNSNKENPECYAVMMSTAERMKSSSGAVYPTLAKKFIQNGGIVYGVVWTEDFYPHFEGTNRCENVDKQRKSKYVQADTEMVFRQIAAQLEENRKVLFSGCPCQVAGLKSYLGRNTENLYTIDIFCHGTPSVKMLKEELKQKVSENKIADVDFRSKSHGWSESSDWLKIRTEDGMVSAFNKTDSAYEKGFHQGIILRESCLDCPFCAFPRQGDLTLGDFWGIKGHDPEMDDEWGTSAVLVNSPHGENLFATIKDECYKIKKAPLEWLKDNRVSPKRAAHFGRPYFKFLMQNHVSFENAVETALAYRFRIGIIGPWMNINHGGALTYYALYEALREWGYYPVMISQPKNSEWSPDPQYCRFKELPYPSYAIAPATEDYPQQNDWNNNCDIFIVGSDQLFTVQMLHLLDGYADLEWVDSNKKMIAYAASFAYEHFYGTEHQHKRLEYFLKRFDSFSVREESGISLLKNEFGIESQWVLDPVFLCDPIKFYQLAERGKERVPSHPYVFGYVLDPDERKQNVMQTFADALHINCHAITDVSYDAAKIKTMWTVRTLDNAMNEELIAHILHSDFVVTDSFHGVCFCILLKKNFVAIVNKKRGASRFYSVLRLFHLEDRLIDPAEKIENVEEYLRPIDYENVVPLLERERRKCAKWLINAIEKEKNDTPLNDYDMARIYADRLSRDIEKGIKWDRDCLNGRIDWLIDHVEEEKRQAEQTDEKQWSQLEDHRLRLDGVDDVDQRQWKQLENHQLRLDTKDAELADLRKNLEQLKEAELTELRKNLEQLQKTVEAQNREIQRLNNLLRIPLKLEEKLHSNK